MRCKFLCSALLLLAAPLASASEPGSIELKDPHFGEALFYANQGEYFDAIARLDTELKQYYGVDEPELDSLNFHINEAEFSVGDFELYYRMHQRAGRAINAVIEGNVAPEVRNEAIYRLARIYFQKQQHINALHTIERIEGKVADSLIADVAFLKGQIYMANGKFSEAQKLFASLDGDKRYTGFAAYNLGVSLFAQQKEGQGADWLDKAGLSDGDDPAVLAIRDKSNLALASRFMDEG
ncbi:MAG TPA: tetratricopeptide repeat protein, partial [Gammaproteobacteria bacterium]